MGRWDSKVGCLVPGAGRQSSCNRCTVILQMCWDCFIKQRSMSPLWFQVPRPMLVSRSCTPDGPHETDPTIGSIWTVLSTIGTSNAVNVQCPHVGLEGNSAADEEAKRGSSHPYPWTSLQLPQLSSGINRASLRIGTSAIHMPGSIEVLQAASTVTSVGNGIGPGTSAWRWHRYALVNPHW